MDHHAEKRLTHHVRRSAMSLLPLAAALLLAACSSAPVTPVTLYVSPGGSDGSGTGTAAAPLRTLTAAVNLAPAGSTIAMADGVYSAANGESFPLDISGLTVRGQSASGTIVSGTSAALSGFVVLSGETTVRNLTVRGFSTGAVGSNVSVTGGNVLLEDVTVSDGARYGLQILAGAATLRRVTVTGNEDDNIFARGTATIEIVDSVISDSGGADGIDLGGTATLRLRTTRVTGNDGSGIELNNSSSADLGTTLSPGGNTMTGNALDGGTTTQLDDKRPSGGSRITAVGNDFGVPVSGVQTGPATVAGVWKIEAAGNEIDFGPAD
jgi:hypothetical protein